MFKGLINKGLNLVGLEIIEDEENETRDTKAIDKQIDVYARTETLHEDAITEGDLTENDLIEDDLTEDDFMDIYNAPSQVNKPRQSGNTRNMGIDSYNTDYIEESNMDLFDEGVYDIKEVNIQDTIEIDDKKFKDVLKHLSKRGYTITVTGTPGSGTSTIACNMAYLLGKLGFKTLLLDLDTIGRDQHYLTKDNFNCIDKDSDNMNIALNGKMVEVYSCITQARRNVHTLLNGVACEPAELPENADERVRQMLNLFKKDYDFIIIDTPFSSAVEKIPVVLEACNDIVTVCDASSWGIMNLINYVCNIEDSMLLEIIFSQKTNIIFNRHKGVNKVYNRGINLNNSGALKVLDKIVLDLVDFSIGYRFSDMRNIGVLELSNTFESFLGEKIQFCDTPKGQAKMLELLKKLLVK